MANAMSAARILAERRRREIIAPGLSEPSWIMLLDLWLAKTDGRPVSVSSACLASYTPATTALRHLGVLVELGLIERVADINDARRYWLELTEEGAMTVCRFFAPTAARVAA